MAYAFPMLARRHIENFSAWIEEITDECLCSQTTQAKHVQQERDERKDQERE